MTRRLLPILALLCGARGTPAAAQQVVLQFRPVGSVFGAVGGTAPVRPGSLARERKVTAKFVELDERTRTAKLVQWVTVENPQAPGTIPVEVSDLLNQWRQRVAELRRGPFNLQVVALINSYESRARTLQKIREQSFPVVIPPQARLYRLTRESLTALTLNTRLRATGVGTNLNARNEPALLTLTADLEELSVPPPRASLPRRRAPAEKRRERRIPPRAFWPRPPAPSLACGRSFCGPKAEPWWD